MTGKRCRMVNVVIIPKYHRTFGFIDNNLIQYQACGFQKVLFNKFFNVSLE